MLKKQKGITLIALIITIIVMLILVGVTVNVALSGGLFSKAEEAGSKTKIAQIQEALMLKRTEILAEERGKTPDDYGITFDKLDLPTELKTEYENKLKISKDGILYYDASVVTSAAEQNTFKEMGIQEYVESNIKDSYTFTVGEFISKEGAVFQEIDGNGYKGLIYYCVPIENFWPENISSELKNSTIIRTLDGWDDPDRPTFNVTCLDSNYLNLFDFYETEHEEENPNQDAYLFEIKDGSVLFTLLMFKTGNGALNESDYADYSNLTFTISMPEE